MPQGRPTTKKCNRCGETKRLSEYYENSTKADMRNGICKLCQAEVNKKNRNGV